MAHLAGIFLQAVGTTFTFRNLLEVTYDAQRNEKTATITLIQFPDFGAQTPYELPKGGSTRDSDARNRSEAKNLVLRFIDKGADQDLQQLEHVRRTVRAPKNFDWSTHFRRYAQQFEGRTSPDRMARIESFG